MLEAGEGNLELARQLFKCAVKADPSSETTWLVSGPHLASDSRELQKRVFKVLYCLLQLHTNKKVSDFKHVRVTC